jgi:hypothetical protein
LPRGPRRRATTWSPGGVEADERRKHNCLPQLDEGRRHDAAGIVAVVLILGMAMAYSIVMLTLKVTPAGALALLAAASVWSIRILRAGTSSVTAARRAAGS